jgi:hypothetical protein
MQHNPQHNPLHRDKYFRSYRLRATAQGAGLDGCFVHTHCVPARRLGHIQRGISTVEHGI